MAEYAQIIVDLSIEKLDRPFTYHVPQELKEILRIGDLVEVPFGRGNRSLQGFVIGLEDERSISANITVKDIRKKLPENGITGHLIALAYWMKNQYGGTLNQALKTVLPLKKTAKEKKVSYVELLLPPKRVQELREVFQRKHAVARLRLLEALYTEGELPMSVIGSKLQVSSAVVKAFEEEGYVAIRSERRFRNPFSFDGGNSYRPVLNDEQRAAVEGMYAHFCKKDVPACLLHGVTGSGKTEVYMELIQRIVSQGKQVIVLIPEIALTYQTMMRFYHRFGERVSILHSRLSAGERTDQLERARRGEVDIMIGPRSALFTPFEQLGLIILDEEHEGTYKSEDTIPRYHARETAIYRASQTKALVVLGSATPSLESFYEAKNGNYGYYKLEKRYRNRELPAVSVVDLRAELKAGNRSMFSRKLQKEIAGALGRKEQVMLFLNRRGMTGFISCRSCGKAIKCPHCDVSLTLHKDGKMKCHYCGYETLRMKNCPACGSRYLGGFSVGTQKVEESIQALFPSARVLRMDADTTRSKDGYEAILSGFANQEADVLVGTQMIVKGHDFPNVTVVGILAADMSLLADDFRASERTFQLLTQAAGRAGRGEKPGKVVIQTYQPEHFAIQTAKQQNFEEFYEEEISYRQLLSYPPCGHMMLILMKAEKEEEVEQLALTMEAVVNQIAEQMSVLVIGPADARIKKLNNIYRKTCYIKAKEYDQLVQIKNKIEAYREQSGYRYGTVSFDFDPMHGA
ncbi:replication restart DNA helicase PriA [Lachnospiraceae bacterium XBB1006]|nr:replication restart DNA helicase PriA [Lachnospiraceae bacterium XBB1006]